MTDVAQKCASCLTKSAHLFPVIILIESEGFISFFPLTFYSFFFFFPLLLMPGLNGDSLGSTLRGLC